MFVEANTLSDPAWLTGWQAVLPPACPLYHRVMTAGLGLAPPEIILTPQLFTSVCFVVVC